MNLDFLPNLPKADLDDRKFEDLVQECLLRIPRYCPEWTNYNPSDPGVTLIELFSWLTDQMLLRFNQIPRRQYVTFLEMLGIRLQAPAPAQTDLTFYLSGDLPQSYTIPAGIEVATERTQIEAAITFSTDRPLIIGKPVVQHFLTADVAEERPQVLRDRFSNLWAQQPNGAWSGPEIPLFAEQPNIGNCFYLVFDALQPIEGNVVALTIRGPEATPTGINPSAPPRTWEAWDGQEWVPVLLQESDDATQGFSFYELTQQGGNPFQGADVVLHLPQHFPVWQFATYQGRWLRCVCTPPDFNQPPYSASPRILGFSARAIGGTIAASQSYLVENEILGVSDGTPGQKFQLKEIPVLPRRPDEQIVVLPPGGLPQLWTEVSDFADSGPNDLHYTLDSITGEVQFGPLVREPAQLRQQTQERAIAQLGSLPTTRNALVDAVALERQYGAIPPRGSMIRMVAYHTGGGRMGNVQRHTVNVLKSAVPYVTNVTNHTLAINGADAESLEQAVIRVPQMLRSRNRAVTPEDFETLALQAGQGAIARAHCLPSSASRPGVVTLLITPQANLDAIDRGEGLHPDQFALTSGLQQRLLSYLDEHRLLGIEVACEEPEYVGVSVQTEVALEPAYRTPAAQEEILFRLRVALYRFLNPLTGGPTGRGWEFGRPVYPSDVVALFQQVPGISYLGAVQLLEIRKQGQSWVRLPPTAVVNPGPMGLICSWGDRRLRSHHVINLI